MKFGRISLHDAEGAILGHSAAAGGRRLKKGHVLSAADIAALEAAGHTEILAAQLDRDDVPEDTAAGLVANAAKGEGVRINPPFTGRANLYAESAGLAVIDDARVDRLNLIDESITVATIAPFEMVAPGQMLATVKIIPFAAPRAVVAACAAVAAENGPLVRVASFQDRPFGLIMTRLPETKASVLAKTEASLRARLSALGAHLAKSIICDHHEDSVAAAIRELQTGGCAPILIFGASAIVDRRDVIPAGIAAAGGAVEHFGMPVDPGNLLLLGRLDTVPVIAAPGCARSPKINGFDWVLQRVVAGLEVGRRDVMLMGSGGLLMEIESRPMPRDRAPAAQARRIPRIGAVVLAAGQSRRMGDTNKLLAPLDGKPMVAHVVDAALASAAKPIVVVTGHQADQVEAALTGRPVQFVQNPDYAIGLSTSLKRGLDALPSDIDGALICLGDMPRIQATVLDRLIAAFDPVEGRAICVPTKTGKRGNPVLWASRFFTEMKNVAGDVGAKHLIGEHGDLVREVPSDDAAIFLDVDTPDVLADVQRTPA